MNLARLWPLAAALLVAIAAIVPGCSSEKAVPWAASTQPHTPRAAVSPPATRRPAPPTPVVAAAPASQASATAVPPRPATRPARPATTTTSTGEVVRTVRVFCDSNPTPIWVPNLRYTGTDGHRPDAAGNIPWVRHHQAYSKLLRLGARPGVILYVGTINRARTWCDDQWNPKPMIIGRHGGIAVDWTREGNYTDPPDARAIRACAKLAMDPMFYGDDSYPGPRPIVLDIEGTRSLNLVGVEPTLENRRASLKHMIECVRAAKQGSQGKCEVWGYGWFPQAMYYPKEQLDVYEKTRDLERELAKEVSGICQGLYSWDGPVATNGESWFDDLKNHVQAPIDKYYPEMNGRKVMLVLPRWQLIWPEKAKPEHAALQNKPIPIELWKRQIDTLVKEGWELYIWLGGTTSDGVEEHLEYACRFAK